MDQEWMTIKEVSDFTRRSVYSVRRWIDAGFLKAYRLRGKLIIPVSDVKGMIEPREKKTKVKIV